MTYLVLFLMGILLIAAVSILFINSTIQAVIVMSVVSLMASILFLFIAAPDVAITEAAIGSALTTIVFVIAIQKTIGKAAKEKGDYDA
jgi:energy-converting hydrogenase B subunit D